MTLLATDSWTTARDAMVALWKRVHPQRSDLIAEELGEARTALMTARHDGDSITERDLIGEWQGRVRRLLAADPQVSEELRRLLSEELRPAVPQAQGKTVNLHAHGSGNAQINQAGHNLRIHNHHDGRRPPFDAAGDSGTGQRGSPARE
ncbi:hypothetical protein ACN27B_18665 [Micromonospora sp. WMMD754]|uniref:hypothetical protein n=1 Tax=Micromonospora sp. WMMD754 TaxID=3404114 RepID=UPI003BF45FE6